jgi:hypothetical protein
MRGTDEVNTALRIERPPSGGSGTKLDSFEEDIGTYGNGMSPSQEGVGGGAGFRGALEKILYTGDVDEKGRPIPGTEPVLQMTGPELADTTSRMEQAAYEIMGAGFNQDPLLLADFLVAATALDPKVSGVQIGDGFAVYKGSTFPLTPMADDIIASLQGESAMKRMEDEAAAKIKADREASKSKRREAVDTKREEYNKSRVEDYQERRRQMQRGPVIVIPQQAVP